MERCCLGCFLTWARKVFKGAKKALGFAKAAKKYLKPGKYARRSIPARSTSSRLNKRKERVLNKLGINMAVILVVEGT